jgi:hypothetical protein
MGLWKNSLISYNRNNNTSSIEVNINRETYGCCLEECPMKYKQSINFNSIVLLRTLKMIAKQGAEG